MSRNSVLAVVEPAMYDVMSSSSIAFKKFDLPAAKPPNTIAPRERRSSKRAVRESVASFFF